MNLNFTPFPLLHTERLVLRSVGASDDEALYKLRTNEQVMQYIDRPRFKNMEEAAEMRRKMVAGIDANESVNWAMTLKESDVMIGSMAFWRIEQENHRAEIGYMLMPAYHGKGLMQEAMVAALEYGFNTMRLHSVEATVNPANAASIGLLEKNGFVKEGHFKENYFFDGRFLDSATYSLLNPAG